MSASHETRFAGGTCFRCTNPGHWADSTECPWLAKARTRKEHEQRLHSFMMRFLDEKLGLHQKREYIRQENAIWKVKA